jgi:hypothetical protein
MELSSEFASVDVTLDEAGNGPRLRVEDLRTGHDGFLDPLELETLAWLPEGALHRFLDPSLHRWRDDGVLERLEDREIGASVETSKEAQPTEELS